MVNMSSTQAQTVLYFLTQTESDIRYTEAQRDLRKADQRAEENKHFKRMLDIQENRLQMLYLHRENLRSMLGIKSGTETGLVINETV